VVCSVNCALQSKSWGAQCADAYKKGNSGPCNDPLIANPEFAEQENAWLANFKAGAVHMRQTTLLWVLRIALCKRAKDKQGGAAFRRDHASRECAMPREGRITCPTMSPADACEALRVAAERMAARTQAKRRVLHQQVSRQALQVVTTAV
jgi:hypothetical protein